VELVDVFHRAMELRIENRRDEELQVLLDAAEEHEDQTLWAEIANWYADRAFRRNDEAALADFAEAEKWAGLALTRAGLAGIHARRGEFEKADALAAEALAQDPELPESHLALGEVRFRQQRWTDAAQSAARALQLDAKFARAYVLMAEVLSAAGKPEQADEVLDEATKHCTGDDRLLVALARRYVARDEPGRAERALAEAVEMNPENLDAWRMIALAARKDGDESRMILALDRASEIDRDGTLAWIAKENLKLPEGNV
jgi:tetratricopeptide (TPR) repeat protein